MSDPIWNQIEDIFSRALDLPEGEREAFVSVECGGNEELKAEVLQLLGQVDSSSDYLSSLARRVGIPLAGSSAEGLVGRDLGPYRLLHLLGRGGMGAVFLAEGRKDGFTVKAAVKVVSTGIMSESVRRRFREERRILAGLQHPNIARLFDGGVTEDGTPYLVMEYVPGRPIDEHCDALSSSVEDRIRLFLEVCEAVEHAHRNLVIHRDLKPTNVLVTESGTVKLLDFGIARALDPEGSDTLTATFHPRPMTLAWASPEQVQGLPVATTTDVYGLGLLLYRLLTGHHPYEVPGDSLSGAERVICETDPRPPHLTVDGPSSGVRGKGLPPTSSPGASEVARRRGTTPARLKKDLGGDLGRILLMALRKEPERRYGSVADLAEDLRRYLGHLPVSARPDSRFYRLNRFVTRHKAAVVVGALLGVLSLSLLTLGIRHTLTTRAHAAEIAREAQTTQEVTEFLLEILALSDPGDGLGDTLTVRAALERGVAHHRDHLANRPELRARMLEVMAEAYSGLGMNLDARALLQEALALRNETNQVGDSALAGTLTRLAAVYSATGRYSEAASFNGQALEVFERIGADSVLIGSVTGDLAVNLGNLGRPDSARALGGRALAVLRRHAGEYDPLTLRRASDYAWILRRSEEVDSAESLYREVLARVDPSQEETGELAVQTLNNLGFLLRSKGELEEAASLYRTALGDYGRWMVPSRRMTTLVNLASVQSLLGDSTGTEATLRERLSYAQDRWPEGSWRIGGAALALGRYYLERERFADAERFLREAVASYSESLRADHGWTANAESLLGSALGHLGKFDEGERFLLHGYENLLAGPGPEDRWTVDAVRRLAEFYELQGRSGEAARYRRLISSEG